MNTYIHDKTIHIQILETDSRFIKLPSILKSIYCTPPQVIYLLKKQILIKFEHQLH